MKEPYFIQPNIQSLEQLGLNYKDLLVYAILRVHMNNVTKTAFPSIRRLSKLSGLSLKPIQDALRRLDKSGLITIHKQKLKQSNVYSFSTTVKFKMIPKSMLEHINLSTEEKAVLIGIRQFFNDDKLSTTHSIPYMANILNINYHTLLRHMKELKSRGFINDELRYTVEIVEGQKIMNEKPHLILNQDEINWRLEKVEKKVEGLEEHVNQLKDHASDTDLLLAIMLDQMNLTKEQIKELIDKKRLELEENSTLLIE